MEKRGDWRGGRARERRWQAAVRRAECCGGWEFSTFSSSPVSAVLSLMARSKLISTRCSEDVSGFQRRICTRA